jgi:diguanylate cyclase (GGDEF)-like protein
MNQRLREAVRVDALTGLPSRYALNERVAARAAARVSEDPLGLIYLDLDGFTAVNRRLGDAGGDRIIQQAAQFLQSKLPGGTELYRHEADEFVVLLPSGDGHRTVELAKRLRAAMAEAEWPMRSHESLKLTVAAGVLAWPADRPLPEPDALIEGARAACRHAAHAGGNRLRVLEPGDLVPRSG